MKNLNLIFKISDSYKKCACFDKIYCSWEFCFPLHVESWDGSLAVYAWSNVWVNKNELFFFMLFFSLPKENNNSAIHLHKAYLDDKMRWCTKCFWGWIKYHSTYRYHYQ
jgi:hypothetical protein